MIFNLSDAPEVMYWNGIGSGSEGIWVDKLSRKLFPLVFTLFNLLYWIICCSAGHKPYPANVTPHPIELIEGWPKLKVIFDRVYPYYLSCLFILFIIMYLVYLCHVQFISWQFSYRHTVFQTIIKDSLHIQCMLFIFKHPLNKNGTSEPCS